MGNISELFTQNPDAGARDMGKFTSIPPKKSADKEDDTLAGMDKDIVSRMDKNDAEYKKKLEPIEKELQELKVPGTGDLEKIMASAPKPPTRTPFEDFGSSASILGILGSALSKRPLTSALNASASAMTAAREGREEDFKTAYQSWKQNVEYAKNIVDYEHERYKEITDKDYHLAEIYGKAFKNDSLVTAAQLKQTSEWMKAQQKNSKILNDTYEKMQSVEFLTESGISKPQAVSMMFGTKAGFGTPGADIDWKNADPKTQVPGTGLTVGAIKQIGEGVVKTGNYNQGGLGYGWNPAKQAVDNYIGTSHPEFNRGEAALKYAGQMTAERLGAKNAENINIAANNLDNSLPLLMEQVKAVSPGELTDWNSFENWLNSRTGDPKIAKLRNAVNDTKADYAMLLARGGIVTDTVRGSAEENLNAAFSSGQFEGVADIIRRTSQNQKAAARQALDEVSDVGSPKEVSLIPPEAASDLRKDPSDTMKKHFDEVFGEGSADKVLAK